MQAIVIPGSLETRYDQSSQENLARGEPRESTPILPALQVVHPLDRPESRPGKAKLVLSERKRSFPPDRILLNSYIPPRGPALAMEEVTTLGPDEINLILHR